MPWLLNLCYTVALLALAPVLLWQRIATGKRRPGLWAKLTGAVSPRTGGTPMAWFHAVSVGEILQLEPLVAGCRQRWPEWEILVTTTTASGHRLATERFGEDCRVDWFPLDFSWAVRRALKRLQPDLIVLVELELWPNFLAAADRAEIPVALVNGRVSERSFQGYRRIRWLISVLLRSIDCLVVQSEPYATRLERLGAPSDRITVSGSIKFDRIETNRDNAATQFLADLLNIGRRAPVFVAGSTQDPEERLAIRAWEQARQAHPDLRLIIVPRHPERFDEVAELISEGPHGLIRRSRIDTPVSSHTPSDIVLLDTIGELSACWGLANVAFVGGSLTNRGGQNMIEPAAFGAAILFGPNTQNFQDIVEELLERGAARVVADGEALANRLAELLDDTSTADALGDAARRYVLSRQGATSTTLDCLQPLFETKAPLDGHLDSQARGSSASDVAAA